LQQCAKPNNGYGARHMRTTIAFLMQKLNYRVVKAEWVKVFDL
jgi:hypothetical protein